jgi:hypothetical protein
MRQMRLYKQRIPWFISLKIYVVSLLCFFEDILFVAILHIYNL